MALSETHRKDESRRDENTYEKTVGGTYSERWILHISEETHGTVHKHPDTDAEKAHCTYCGGEA